MRRARAWFLRVAGSFQVVAPVLVASGFTACLLPALRSARIDPMLSLRCE